MKVFDLQQVLDDGNVSWIEQLVADRFVEYKVKGFKEPFRACDLLINAVLWRPLIQRGLKIEDRHSFRNEPFTTDIQKRIHTNVYKDVLEKLPETKNTIQEEMVISINVIYNIICMYLGRYQKTIDMFSLSHSYENPDITSACYVSLDKPHEQNINTAEAKLKKSADNLLDVLTDPELKDVNVLFPFTKMGVVSSYQIPQVMLAAGTRTDINDAMILKPIKSPYVKGLRDIHEIAIDSNMARKSIMYNKKSLPITRYGDRIQQLLSSVLDRVYPGDCGTELTVPFFITDKNYKNIVGKFSSERGKLRELTYDNIKDYIGKEVRLRSILVCRHTDGCCHICGGRLIDYFPENLVIGIESTIQLLGPIGQLILSNKHVSLTSTITYQINQNFEPFLYSRRNEILFREGSPTKKFAIGIPFNDVSRLTDLKYVETDNAINDQHFSSVNYMSLVRNDREEILVPSSLMKDGNEPPPYLSKEMLLYIKNHPELIKYSDAIVWIDLKKFDKTKPIMCYTVFNSSTIRFNKQINNLFSYIDKFKSITEALKEFSNLIYQRTDVNLFHLEVILRSYMITNQDDYRIPIVKDIDDVHFDKLFAVIFKRSYANAFAFQNINNLLSDPQTYSVPRQDSEFSKFVGFLT